jgi:PAS domain S-box-containing protein
MRPDPGLACGEEHLECPAGLACAWGIDRGVFSQARLLARLLDGVVQPFVGVDFEGKVTCLNRSFAALAGLESLDLVGRSLSELTPERWRDGQARALAKVKATGRSLRFEAECLRCDGRVVPIEVAAGPDHDARGEAVGVFAFVTDLSERRLAEVALRASEERFRKLYDNAPVGYHEVDREGRIVSINRTECEMLGYARDELVGRPVFDLIAEDSRAAAAQAFPDKIAGLKPLRTFERTVLTREGRPLVVSIHERYKRDDEGQVVGLLSTLQDVTERKRTEAALLASERRARALFEGMNDAAFVHAFDGRILDANPAACRLLGYSHEEFLTLTTADVDEPEFAAGFADRLNRQMDSGHLSCEGRHRTKDGRVLPVEINTSAIRFDDERAVLAVIRDISERLALEETRRAFAASQEANAREIAAKNAELTLSEARYRRLTEGCLDGVVVADRCGQVVLLNPAAERAFGYVCGEAIGQPVGRLIPALALAEGRSFEADVRDLRPGFVGQTVELVGRRKNGEEFPLELSLSAVDLDGDVQFIGSIRDQTERHRMRAMLAQSERLASIGLLSAGVAHEINNPLAYVANNLAVLERDLAGVADLVAVYEGAHPQLSEVAPEIVRNALKVAEDLDWPYVRENLPRMFARTREGVQRVATIVSNLRWLARTSPTKLEDVRVADLVESALEMVRVRLRRHHIEIEVEHGVTRLVCVPTQISQVILNLLINASQAIEGSGRSDGGRIRFRSYTEGGWAVLSIADNGPGIPADVVPKLFDPFFTTKSVGEGTGLGLSICHGIITGHGGRIEVDSRPDEGATFRVVLPQHAP